jgi:hypothetical protein
MWRGGDLLKINSIWLNILYIQPDTGPDEIIADGYPARYNTLV